MALASASRLRIACPIHRFQECQEFQHSRTLTDGISQFLMDNIVTRLQFLILPDESSDSVDHPYSIEVLMPSRSF